MLKDRACCRPRRWHEAGDCGTLPVPTNLQGLISSRLDSLAHDDKQLAHDASVVGAVLLGGAVAHLGATDGMVVTGSSAGLADARPPRFHPTQADVERGR